MLAVAVSQAHNLQEVELYGCLKYFPEMDRYYEACESFLNLPSSNENSLSMTWLRDTQQSKPVLIAKANERGTKYHWRDFDGFQLVCHSEKGKEETHWKICLSNEGVDPADSLVPCVIKSPGEAALATGDGSLLSPRPEEACRYL